PRGDLLASGGDDKTVRLWKVSSGAVLHSFGGHEGAVHAIAFSPDGQNLVSASVDKTARIWSLEKEMMIAKLTGHNNAIPCVAWSPDGATIATGSLDRTIRLWNNDGRFRRHFLDERVFSLTFSANSRQVLVTRGGPKRLDCSLLDIGTGKETPGFA